MKIGVFDSGVGGRSVARAIEKALPDDDIIYVDDKQNVPYGSKTPQQLLVIVEPILRDMHERLGCQVIVVACNTVSTTIIKELRAKIRIPLIAIEPMVKPAAEMTKSRVISVCATPTTLASRRYTELKQMYAHNIKVLEPDCSDWSFMIETDQLDHQQIEERIRSVCKAHADVIVLGCTHYHWIQEEIESIAKEYGAQVIQPEPAIIHQLKRVIEQLS